MAVNKDTCGTAVKNFLNSLTPAQKQDIELIWQGIVNEFFEHIKTNGEIYGVKVDTGTGEQIGTAKIK